MAYNEVKERNGIKYYYRVVSVREGDRILKKRIYMGANLNKQSLLSAVQEADKILLSQKKKIILEKLKSKIVPLLIKKGIKKASIFGSYSRGDQSKDSDIDLLIEPPKGMGLEVVALNMALEKLLRKKVDLVSYKYINPHLKKYILNDEVRII